MSDLDDHARPAADHPPVVTATESAERPADPPTAVRAAPAFDPGQGGTEVESAVTESDPAPSVGTGRTPPAATAPPAPPGPEPTLAPEVSDGPEDSGGPEGSESPEDPVGPEISGMSGVSETSAAAPEPTAPAEPESAPAESEQAEAHVSEQAEVEVTVELPPEPAVEAGSAVPGEEPVAGEDRAKATGGRSGRPGLPVVPPSGRPGLLAAPAGQPDLRRSGRRPGVVPRPRPAGRRSATPTVEPMVEPTDPHQWGRIDETGAVFVYSSTGERQVGNWQAGDAEAGLVHYGRRFDDFSTEIAILEKRLANGSGDPKATRAQAVTLRESVDTLAAIGDLDSAAARLEIVIGAADAALAGASQARTAARNRSVAAKEALCAEAESLAESTAWKATGDRLKQIVEEWRAIHGIDRKTDDALWKRFAKARDTFTKHRGTHFADLDKQRGVAREAKEKLIARAQEISTSDDWGRTAGEYRTLMDEWKSSGRAPREVEDQLWQRFRAAQEAFFARRNSTFSQRDSEFEANAAAKEQLLSQAERIDPTQGLDAARAALRSVQERWESAGKVPRERIREFDTRLRAVEERIKRAQDSHWRRTDPETAARVEQFRTRAEGFRTQAAKARAAGDERRAAQADSQAKQWEEWLATAQGSAQG